MFKAASSECMKDHTVYTELWRKTSPIIKVTIVKLKFEKIHFTAMFESHSSLNFVSDFNFTTAYSYNCYMTVMINYVCISSTVLLMILFILITSLLDNA